MRGNLLLWTDHIEGFNYPTLTANPARRRNLVLHSLRQSGFGWQIVFVAGFGFLADAYDVRIMLLGKNSTLNMAR